MAALNRYILLLIFEIFSLRFNSLLEFLITISFDCCPISEPEIRLLLHSGNSLIEVVRCDFQSSRFVVGYFRRLICYLLDLVGSTQLSQGDLLFNSFFLFEYDPSLEHSRLT